MPKTLGYHIVISGYGLWLPGDERGHWSDVWDDQIGFIEPHTLHPGDPARKRMSQERQTHPKLLLDPTMIAIVAETIAECRQQSEWRIAAASIESSHAHLLLTYVDRPIDNTIKWLKDQTTKAIHRNSPYDGPIWCKGRWCSFIFDPEIWRNTRRYIERHNERRGLGSQPYPFLDDVSVPS